MNPAPLLLAQSKIEERLSAIRGGFNDRQTDPTQVTGVIVAILIPVSIVLLVFVVQALRTRIKAGRSSPAHPLKLFDTVLKKMGVRLSDRFLLRAFARSVNVPQPAALLFSRENFERHAARWLERLTIGSLRRHAVTRIAVIADLAFGDRNATSSGQRPPQHPTAASQAPA
ncbi:MAG: hypothetical protein KF841_11425 [Phycisphaerae bacterium]|nr:hypothetical protein [Phycisphaerae bacterium]